MIRRITKLVFVIVAVYSIPSLTLVILLMPSLIFGNSEIININKIIINQNLGTFLYPKGLDKAHQNPSSSKIWERLCVKNNAKNINLEPFNYHEKYYPMLEHYKNISSIQAPFKPVLEFKFIKITNITNNSTKISTVEDAHNLFYVFYGTVTVFYNVAENKLPMNITDVIGNNFFMQFPSFNNFQYTSQIYLDLAIEKINYIFSRFKNMFDITDITPLPIETLINKTGVFKSDVKFNNNVEIVKKFLVANNIIERRNLDKMHLSFINMQTRKNLK
ncbi:hypothetical protein [Spiroplasma endosymbiont of Crioceris asparagi]|uniref:hypothetical protein n=1 Tax=Spiroplasma endosymbiont of Crioceris asparagi TaxID=3066286 RepID=UPI0030D0E038